jgi:hypothetical protein
MSLPRWSLLALSFLAAACDTPPTPASAANAAGSAHVPVAVRMPVFVDRMKQVPFERGRARMESIRASLLSPSLSQAQTTALGFECASLRAEQLALAKETDPLLARFRADVDKTCGLDVPLATAYAELRSIEQKRQSHLNVKSDCLGLKVALGDFGAQYTSNPMVAEIGGKFATFCNTSD